MVIKALHFLLLPIAATFGWYVGRRDHSLFSSRVSNQLRRDYFQGLNYLISEQPDKAVDVFIKLLEVDSDTVEIHLALGHLFRRRGEVDRAIRIHQNLMARPQLDRRYHVQALFALGQDYLRAGVLDRAEQQFSTLVELGEEKQNSLCFLLRIYQQEKDWRKAIEIAKKLSHESEESTNRLIAQFYCELAEQEASQENITQALDYLQQAKTTDSHCVRANLMAGHLAQSAQHYQEAIVFYQQVRQQDIHFIPEIISPLCECYQQLDKEMELVEYLQKCLQDYPNIGLVLTVSNYLQRQKGDNVALEFIADHVKHEPSLHGLNRLAGVYLTNSGHEHEKLVLLQSFIQQLLVEKLAYRCLHCGFSTRMLFWNCPSCHGWSTIKPTQGVVEVKSG